MPNTNPNDQKAQIPRYRAITIGALVLCCIFSVISWLRVWVFWGFAFQQPGLGVHTPFDLIEIFGLIFAELLLLFFAFKSSSRQYRFVFVFASLPIVAPLLRALLYPELGVSVAMLVGEALCWTIAACLCANALLVPARGTVRPGSIREDIPTAQPSPEIPQSAQPHRRWKISVEAMVVGVGVGIGFGLLAYIFLMYRHEGMGETLFILVPVSAGFSIGIMTRRKGEAIATALALTSPLLLLVLFGAEGTLCALLAFPILLAAIGTGLVIGMAVKALIVDDAKHQTTTMGALLLLGPMMVIGGNRLERPLLEHPRIEVIRDSVTVNAPPDQVWKDILSIDNIQASKPFLMYIGLPIPEKCVLQREGAGARRTCYFNNGYIEETVTGWNPPYSMGLTIDRTHMPGRHWLGFESAEYTLQASGTSTILTRTTTISSHLLPRWYWRPLERLGVESEHKYILQDVAMRTGTHSLR